mgnify:CR=1 FL=1
MSKKRLTPIWAGTAVSIGVIAAFFWLTRPAADRSPHRPISPENLQTSSHEQDPPRALALTTESLQAPLGQPGAWMQTIDDLLRAGDTEALFHFYEAAVASGLPTLKLASLYIQIQSSMLRQQPIQYVAIARFASALFDRLVADDDFLVMYPDEYARTLRNMHLIQGAAGNRESAEAIQNMLLVLAGDQEREALLTMRAGALAASGDGQQAAEYLNSVLASQTNRGERPSMPTIVSTIILPARAGHEREKVIERLNDVWASALPHGGWDAVYVGEHLGGRLREAGQLQDALSVHLEILDIYRRDQDAVYAQWRHHRKNPVREHYNEFIRTMHLAAEAREYETAYLLAMEIAERYDTPGNDLGRTRAEGYARMLGIPHDPPPYADPSAPH